MESMAENRFPSLSTKDYFRREDGFISQFRRQQKRIFINFFLILAFTD